VARPVYTNVSDKNGRLKCGNLTAGLW